MALKSLPTEPIQTSATPPRYLASGACRGSGYYGYRSPGMVGAEAADDPGLGSMPDRAGAAGLRGTIAGVPASRLPAHVPAACGSASMRLMCNAWTGAAARSRNKKSATRLRLRLKPLQWRRVEETSANNGLTCIPSRIKPFKVEAILA